MAATPAEASGTSIKVEKKKGKKEKREKSAKKLEEQGEMQEVEVEVEAKTGVESKEERRARRKAEKSAKPEGAEASTADHADAAELSAPTGDKGKEKKRKHEDTDDDVQNTFRTISECHPSHEASTKKNKKDKKGEKRNRDADDVVVESSSTEKAAASSTTTDGQKAGTTGGEVQQKKSKKDKKDKKDKKRSDIAPEEQPTSGTGVFADTSLSEQAQKALHYVQEHASHHLASSSVVAGKGWKFNKAKQNWLIRQVWSETEVPEKYVDDVMGYLNSIKGGGRAALLETARKYVTAPEPTFDEQPKENVEEPEQAASTKDGEAGDEAKDAKPKAEEVDGGDDENTVTLWQLRKSRGEKLLAVMSAA